jgi:hypothetical protein
VAEAEEVLDIVYRVGDETREVSIAAYDAPAKEAFALLQVHAPT